MKVDDSSKQRCPALWYNIYLFHHFHTYISIVINEVQLHKKKSHKLGLRRRRVIGHPLPTV